ncbi:MAG: chloride channel protein [Caldilineaceae bacterium]|nr:chloride channel protein [Caldilineaceae bacterium]
MTESAESAAPPVAQNDTPSGQSESRLVGIGPGHILLFALLVALFSAVWFGSYQVLNSLIWDNDFVENNRWTLPLGVLVFSLLVGLAQKYLHAANAIEGDAMEPLMAGDATSYKSFWGTLVTSFCSLLSGASVGPEGPLGYLAVDVSEWIAIKLKLPKEGFVPAAMAGVSAAYNGIVGNAVLTAVMTSETSKGKGGLPVLVSNLAAGAVGFLVFGLLGVPPFAGALKEGQPFDLSLGLALWAVALGLIGALLAVYIGLAMQVAGRAMGAFGDRVVTRVMVAGVIIAVVVYFVPALMFSGEGSLSNIMANPAQAGIATMLLLAAAKPLLLALSLKSGYLGGPIFPCLFSAILIGLCLSLLFPDVPISILTACIQVAVVALVLNAPLTSILLVSIITAADANLLGLIVVAAVTAIAKCGRYGMEMAAVG